MALSHAVVAEGADEGASFEELLDSFVEAEEGIRVLRRLWSFLHLRHE